MEVNIELGAMKIKDYPRFTLYKIFKKIGNKFIPIYNTTLSKNELRKYEVL